MAPGTDCPHDKDNLNLYTSRAHNLFLKAKYVQQMPNSCYVQCLSVGQMVTDYLEIGLGT